ncbi:hypothetical protein Vlu01_04190 [Micromonospora lutea]|uniref:Uncharacterized protein n=1 Tax=Micromonospora lutea TaxID=419825 RepID=A0ABQ4IPF7_9ACTN|nr:hypothetical protein Vlu01_04190 [Micromonospora lutea]
MGGSAAAGAAGFDSAWAGLATVVATSATPRSATRAGIADQPVRPGMRTAILTVSPFWEPHQPHGVGRAGVPFQMMALPDTARLKS